jgi:integrase
MRGFIEGAPAAGAARFRLATVPMASGSDVLLTGVRTEEARALTWDHVDLDGDLAAHPPIPPYVAVWPSVRTHGDTKTERSRRTLQLSERVVKAVREHHVRQAEQRLLAGDLWQDRGLVFCTSVGSPLDAANARQAFRKITKTAGLGEQWAPRELRTSFVSLTSDSGVPVEEIAHRPLPAQPGDQAQLATPWATPSNSTGGLRGEGAPRCR